MATSGSLITRNYANFLGVDFSNFKVNVYRSPDSKNMWKNYKELGKYIETRPVEKILEEQLSTLITQPIYGLFFLNKNNTTYLVIHAGVSLYSVDMANIGQEVVLLQTLKATGMNPKPSKSFIHNGNLYIKDGINYLKCTGIAVSDVEGFVPTTTISMKPSGEGTTYQEVNLLTGKRKNSFIGDGTTRLYHLDTQNLTSSTVVAKVNGTVTTALTVNTTNGTVEFYSAPPAPLTDGQDNVEIEFTKTITGYRDRILKCNILEVFDNRVFFSGNVDYPSTVFYSGLENPEYCSDLDYSEEGMDGSLVKSMVAGNNALWVFKEPSQANTTIFYHTPSIDADVGKVYPSTHSNISEGCLGTAINFNDDIVMLGQNGLEGISGEIGNEQVLGHRSSLVDSKLLKEANYKKAIFQEWQGYLLIIIDTHVYLADTRQKFANNNSIEYEWYYWEFAKTITTTAMLDGNLYLGTQDGKIYKMTPDAPLSTETIASYWTTCKDDIGYLNYQKITNKKGCVADIKGAAVTIAVATDNNNFETIDTFTNTKGYIVPRIKRKKWKDIQFKFSSNKAFGVNDFSIQCFIGSYVKR